MLDLCTDLSYAILDSRAVARAVNDDGVFLIDLDLAGVTELLHSRILEFKSEFARNDLAAGEDSDVAEHFFSLLTEGRSLDGNYGEGAAQFVQHDSGKSFAVNILGDDKELLAALNDLLKYGKDILNRGDLLVCDEDVAVVKNSFHLLAVGSHVGREVAAVELHTFNDLGVGLGGLGLLNGDNTVGGDLFHCVGNECAYDLVAGGNSADAGDIIGTVDLLCACLEAFDSAVNSLFHTLAQDHGVRACGNVLHALVDHCLGKQSCGRCTVARSVVGLCGDFLDELSAHVLGGVVKLDLLGDGNTVIGDKGSAVLLVKNNVSALRAESDLYCVGELVNTAQKRVSCIYTVINIFCHNNLSSSYIVLHSVDNGEYVFFGNDSVLGTVKLYLGACILAGDDLIADLESHGNDLAVIIGLAGSYGYDLSDLGLFLSGGRKDDTRLCFLLRFDELYNNSVCQRFNVHYYSSLESPHLRAEPVLIFCWHSLNPSANLQV